MIFGGGCPEALQIKVTLSSSCAATSADVSSLIMSGGTVGKITQGTLLDPENAFHAHNVK